MSSARYFRGYANGIDHGIRLRAELRLPIYGCNVCNGSHGLGEQGELPGELPATTLVLSGGNPVVHEGSPVVHG